MCSYCRQTRGHHPRCPFAEPSYVYECDECGGGIYHDEKYLEIGGEYICEKCVNDMMKYAEREEL